MKPIVTVFGGSVVDLIFQLPKHYLVNQSNRQTISLPFGSKIHTSDYAITIGGSGANVAAGLAKQDYDVFLRTGLAKDALANFVRDELRKQKVEVIDSEVSGSTAVSIVLRLLGDRSIITGSSQQPTLPVSGIPDDGWIHLGPLPEDSDSLLEKITQHRLKTGQGMSMNPSIGQIEQRSRLFQSSLRLLDVIFLNLSEARRLTRSPERAQIGDVVRSLHSLGIKIACVTDGEHGAFVSSDNHIWQADAVCDRVCRVDATGAGDGFASGFLGHYIDSNNPDDDETCQLALKAAMLNSGAVVEGIGAQATLLNSQEIEEDLGRVKIRVIK